VGGDGCGFLGRPHRVPALATLGKAPSATANATDPCVASLISSSGIATALAGLQSVAACRWVHPSRPVGSTGRARELAQLPAGSGATLVRSRPFELVSSRPPGAPAEILQPHLAVRAKG